MTDGLEMHRLLRPGFIDGIPSQGAVFHFVQTLDEDFFKETVVTEVYIQAALAVDNIKKCFRNHRVTVSGCGHRETSIYPFLYPFSVGRRGILATPCNVVTRYGHHTMQKGTAAIM